MNEVLELSEMRLLCKELEKGLESLPAGRRSSRDVN